MTDLYTQLWNRFQEDNQDIIDPVDRHEAFNSHINETLGIQLELSPDISYSGSRRFPPSIHGKYFSDSVRLRDAEYSKCEFESEGHMRISSDESLVSCKFNAGSLRLIVPEFLRCSINTYDDVYAESLLTIKCSHHLRSCTIKSGGHLIISGPEDFRDTKIECKSCNIISDELDECTIKAEGIADIVLSYIIGPTIITAEEIRLVVGDTIGNNVLLSGRMKYSRFSKIYNPHDVVNVGDGNTLTIKSAKEIIIEGDNNVIIVTTPETTVVDNGNYNKVYR